MKNDPQAREELMRLGYRRVPVTVVGDQAVEGFNKAKLEQLLGLRQ